MHLGTMKLHPEVSVSICFDLPAWPARDRHGGKIGPQKLPHVGAQTQLAPRRSAGRSRGGERAAPFFRCAPLHPGTVRWGL